MEQKAHKKKGPFLARLKKLPKGQVLGITLVFGAILLLFALTMVYVLRSTIRLSVRTVAGTSAVLGCDAAVDKAIHALEEGNNWGTNPGLNFTPIPGYKADKVYTDIPNTQYLVQVDAGNLLVPPGDLYYERTITVDLYTTKVGVGVPTAQPTPWLRGGPIPTDYTNHRRIQAAVRRGTLSSALTGGGGMATNGNFKVYWGDVYDYYVPAAGITTVIDLGNNANIGPGYPAYHTVGYGQSYGCIKSSGSCAGCLGTGTGSGAVYCNTTDSGAANCKMYPRDPNMPPKPSVDLPGLEARAKTIYKVNGVSSGESGYFYYSSTIASSGVTGANSVSITGCAGCTMVANEKYHQYNSTSGNEFDPAGSGGSSMQQVYNVLYRMAVNLKAGGVTGVTPGTWVGNDDLVVFVDTQDGNPLASDHSNTVIGKGTSGTNYAVDFKSFAFKGTFILNGSWQNNGPAAGNSTLLSPPSSAWCPSSFTDTPNFNGFLYIAGDLEKLTGTPMIYGSVDLEGDFKATGNVKLYYRNDFNYNMIETGTVATTGWKEVTAFPTPLN
jgi:hypothetical protein